MNFERKKKTKILKISFFAPRSIRLNFLVSPRFQKLITLCWTDEIVHFLSPPRFDYDLVIQIIKFGSFKISGQVMAVRAIHQARLGLFF